MSRKNCVPRPKKRYEKFIKKVTKTFVTKICYIPKVKKTSSIKIRCKKVRCRG